MAGTDPGTAEVVSSSMASDTDVIDKVFSRDAEIGTQEDANWEEGSGEQQPKSKIEREDEGEPKEVSTEETEEAEEQSSIEEDEPADGEKSKFQLPKQQAKDYEKSVWEHYAKRFGVTLEDVEASTGLKHAIKGKIDSDILIQQQQDRIRALQTRQDETEQAAQETGKQQQDPAAARKQYFENLEKFTKANTDPELASQFGEEFLQMLGFKPEELAKMKEQGFSGDKITSTLSKYSVNLMNTVVPQLLGQWVEQAYPNFSKMYQDSLHHLAWEQVREGDEALRSMPSYKSPEFRKMMGEAVEQVPELMNMVFNGKDGRALPEHENIRARYRLAAMIATGRQVTPETITQAVETGKKIQREAERIRSAGKLNAGKTEGKLPAGKDKQLKGSGLGILEEYNSREGSVL